MEENVSGCFILNTVCIRYDTIEKFNVAQGATVRTILTLFFR